MGQSFLSVGKAVGGVCGGSRNVAACKEAQKKVRNENVLLGCDCTDAVR